MESIQITIDHNGFKKRLLFENTNKNSSKALEEILYKNIDSKDPIAKSLPEIIKVSASNGYKLIPH